MQYKSPNKIKYQQFVNENSDIPIFFQPWWMDAVCKPHDSWDVLIYGQNDEIKGVFLYYFTIKYGMKFIIQPQLTQYNGIWLKYNPEMSGNEKLCFEKKAISNLIGQLEKIKFAYLNFNFPLQFSNWLPFYWQGFKQTTRYTLQLRNIKDSNLLDNFKDAKKRQIKKAIKNLKVRIGMNTADFYNLLKLNFESRGKKVLYSETFFEKLYKACRIQNRGEIIAVYDNNNNIHAALFIVWDKNRAYHLIPTVHPEFKSSGASSLVVYEAIKFVSQKVNIYDFEGSMAQGIENSYSQFGGEQVPYFNIQKHNSLIIKLFKTINYF